MSLIEDRLLTLATCLCAEIENHPTLPGVCFCGVLPGEEVAFDYTGDCTDKCGMAWVRLASTYASTVVGETSARPGNCASMLGFDVEIGIIRCIEGMDNQGNPPPPESLLAASMWQWEDMETMRRAIVCCEGSKSFLLGQYTPVGPTTVVGGMWTVSMQET